MTLLEIVFFFKFTSSRLYFNFTSTPTPSMSCLSPSFFTSSKYEYFHNFLCGEEFAEVSQQLPHYNIFIVVVVVVVGVIVIIITLEMVTMNRDKYEIILVNFITRLHR